MVQIHEGKRWCSSRIRSIRPLLEPKIEYQERLDRHFALQTADETHFNFAIMRSKRPFAIHHGQTNPNSNLGGPVISIECEEKQPTKIQSGNIVKSYERLGF
jgi:hypothetical protein